MILDMNQVTANLVVQQLHVDVQYIMALPMNTPVIVDNPVGMIYTLCFTDLFPS